MRALLVALLLLPPLAPAAQAQETPAWRRLDVALDPDAGILLLTDGRDLHLFSETTAYRIDVGAENATRFNVSLPDPALVLSAGYWEGGGAYLMAARLVSIPYVSDPPYERPGDVVRYDPTAGAYALTNVPPAGGGLVVANGATAYAFGVAPQGEGGPVWRFDPARGGAPLDVTLPADLTPVAGGWLDGRAVVLAHHRPGDLAGYATPGARLVRLDPETGVTETMPLPHAADPEAGAWDGRRLWSVTAGEVYALDPRTGELEVYATPPPVRMFSCVAAESRLHCIQLTHDGRGNRAVRVWTFDPALDASTRVPHPDDASADAPPPPRRIVLREGHLWPAHARILAGSNVTWHNLENATRTLESDDGRIRSPPIPPGGNFSLQLPRDANATWSYRAGGTSGALHLVPGPMRPMPWGPAPDPPPTPAPSPAIGPTVTPAAPERVPFAGLAAVLATLGMAAWVSRGAIRR